VDNDLYFKTKELYSLYLARDKILENTIISYGDIVFRRYILNDLLNDNNEITIIVDADYEYIDRQDKDLVITSKPYSKKLYDETVSFIKMSSDIKREEINGEFIGLWKVNNAGAKIVKYTLDKLSKQQGFEQMTTTNLFNEIVKKHPIAVKYIKGSWIDVDSIVDLLKAGGIKR
jgi:phosphoenolpyruvate phosphomutase